MMSEQPRRTHMPIVHDEPLIDHPNAGMIGNVEEEDPLSLANDKAFIDIVQGSEFVKSVALKRGASAGSSESGPNSESGSDSDSDSGSNSESGSVSKSEPKSKEDNGEGKDSVCSSDDSKKDKGDRENNSKGKRKKRKIKKKKKIKNEAYLLENLQLLNMAMDETKVRAEEIKLLHSEAQVEIDLNQLAMVNIANYISELLKGKRPERTPLKSLLDSIKGAMLTFYDVKEGGRWPATVKYIEALFQHVYDL